jgi:5'-methylthioadenosine phosphorylase
MAATRTWPPGDTTDRADIGVFGGSGFYEFLRDVQEISVDTPYGAASERIAIGRVGDRRVAFLARHGHHHTIPAHAVNYRANLWALHSLGVKAVISPFSCGSLKPELAPGEFVVVDDLVDRTWARADTFFDGRDGVVNHVTFGHPYSAALRPSAIAACESAGVRTHDGGTVVVINGPRFSTRAESRGFSSMGWSVVNMTQYPETVLAAELGLPIVGIALVTDYDAGLEGADGPHGRPVTMEEVFATMKANVANVRQAITNLVPNLPIS